MTDPNQPAAIDSLLGHAQSVRRIARSLVGRDRADDLVQDVWLNAIQHPERPTGSVKAWLSRVLVNRARQNHRSHRRREHREQQTATPEAREDPTVRFELHRDLVARIDELDEPWRRTILLRYFDELSLKEIAELDGVPVPTVNTRLRKAKELLRERLDRDYDGDRKAWGLALVPLMQDPSSLLPLTPAVLTGIGAPLITMKLHYVLSAVAAVALAAFFFPRGEVEPLAPALEASNSKTDDLAANAERPLEVPAVSDDAGDRQRVQEVAASTVAEPAEEAVAVMLTGRVIDSLGAAMPGLEVWSSEGEGRLMAVSAGDGSFPIDPKRDIGSIEVRDAVWGTALGCRLPRGARTGPTLIVARRFSVGGTVRNEEGDVIPNAQIVCVQPTSLGAAAQDLHGSAVSHEPVTRTNEMGAFHFAETLAVDGTELLIEAQGYAQASVAMPLYETSALEIVMRRPDATEDVVLGQVVDSTGRPVSEAWVSLGHLCVKSDASGNFRLERGHEGQFDRLVAAKLGYLPVILERPQTSDDKPGPWPDFVLLQLGTTPLELSGRVVDSAGNPLPDWKVWPSDATYFSSIDQRGVMAEGLSLGLLDAGDPEEVPNAQWPWTLTDEDGRFVLGGLFDRSYQLKVLHGPSMLLIDAGTFAAGSHDAEIVIDLGTLFGPIEGHVTRPDGEPIAGVTIQTWVTTYTAPHGDNGMLFWDERGEPTTTDESGFYRIERLPRDGATIHLSHPDILPKQFALRSNDEGGPVARDAWDAIDFVCTARFQLQVELSPSVAESGALTLLNDAGESTLIQVFSAGGHMSTSRYHFKDGKTEVLTVSGDVRELVLYDAEHVEITRQPVQLVFGELNTIRF